MRPSYKYQQRVGVPGVYCCYSSMYVHNASFPPQKEPSGPFIFMSLSFLLFTPSFFFLMFCRCVCLVHSSCITQRYILVPVLYNTSSRFWIFRFLDSTFFSRSFWYAPPALFWEDYLINTRVGKPTLNIPTVRTGGDPGSRGHTLMVNL